MIPIIKNIVPEELWPLKCTFAMEPSALCIHNTANDATAREEAAYVHSNPDATSYHFAVDGEEAVQILPLGRNGWHAGDGALGEGNRTTVGIEICYSKSGGERFAAAQESAARLCAYLMKLFDWGLDTSRITKHEDWSGKHCPHRTLDETGWEVFLSMVEEKYKEMFSEDIPMTDAERKEYDAKIASLEERLQALTERVEPCTVSVNWDEHVTPDMGGAEAVRMLNTMKKNGDFKGVDGSHYGLSAQMVRLMLIFYRLITRIAKKNGLEL